MRPSSRRASSSRAWARRPRAPAAARKPNLAPPRITDIEVGDGEVWLAVDGTVPYLNYTIVSGETPDNLKTDYFSEVVEGDGTSEIAIGTVKLGMLKQGDWREP